MTTPEPGSPEVLHKAFALLEAVAGMERDAAAAAIRRSCGDDLHLLAEALSLLDASAGAETPIDEPIFPDLVQRLSSIFAAALEEPAIPSRIGRYRIDGELGRGGSAVVLRAMQDSPQRPVALKVLMRLPARKAIRHFQSEVAALATMAHPGIAAIYDAGMHNFEWGSCPWIAMEIVAGVPITEYAAKADLSWQCCVDLIADVCEAVEHAHLRGVMHLDLKPGNVFVLSPNAPGSRPRVKVMDFGLAKFITPIFDDTMTLGGPMGTIAYAAPEQLSRLGGTSTALDLRTDVYALGIMLHELIRGEAPFDASRQGVAGTMQAITTGGVPTLQRRDGGRVPAELQAVVSRATALRPDLRYRTAGEFGDDLRRILRGEPVQARALTLAYRTRCLARTRPALATGLLAGALGVCAVVIGTTYGMARARSAEAMYREQRNALIERVQALDAITDLRSDDVRAADVRASRETIVELLRGMAAREPKDLQLAADLSIAIVKLGDLDLAQRKLTDAHARYTEALAIDERLAKAEPRNRRYADNLVRSHTRMAWICEAQSKLDEAAARVATAVESAKALLTLAPDNALSTHALADALLSQAIIAAKRQDRAAAASASRAAWDSAVNLRDGWQLDPHLAGLIARVVSLQVPLGGMTQNDFLQAAQETLPTLEAVLSEEPRYINLGEPIATVYRKLGAIHSERGDLDAARTSAIKCGRVALRLQKAWSTDHPAASADTAMFSDSGRVANVMRNAIVDLAPPSPSDHAERDRVLSLLSVRFPGRTPAQIEAATVMARNVAENLDPANLASWLVLAECLLAEQDAAAARLALLRAETLLQAAAHADDICLSPNQLWVRLASHEDR